MGYSYYYIQLFSSAHSKTHSIISLNIDQGVLIALHTLYSFLKKDTTNIRCLIICNRYICLRFIIEFG